MPRMGEGIVECTVLSILKKVGDKIEADDSVMEVATDKVDTEIPASAGGIITAILVNVNDVIPIGSVVMKISTTAVEIVEETIDKKPETKETQVAVVEIEKQIADFQLITQPTIFSSANRFYSPLVKTIAQKEGISINELEKIIGTGAEGRVTKHDVLGYLGSRQSAVGSQQSAAGVQQSVPNHPTTQQPNNSTTQQPNHQITQSPNHSMIVPMDRMRKLIAERMIESKRISAHVTSYVECDMTKVVQWRNSVKERFKADTGENLTFTPILIQAIVKAIQEFPNINISVEGDTIIQKPDINIGMAVALPSGNLIVPVIHNADRYDLAGLSKKVNDLANRARNNKLVAADLVGGTYTISNIGTFGNLMGTPIIVQPQVAIMAFGMIQKRPVVIENADGDFIGIRSMMYLSHSYDHRVVDGALGGLFVKRVADFLEEYVPKIG